LLVLAGMMAALVVPPLFTRDLWNPDEPRYAEVAREMLVTGQYLVPHLNGELYPDKPPLYFWAVAALWKLGFGLNAGRVLVGLCSLGTLAAVYLFVRRQAGGGWALLASAVTLTCSQFVVHVSVGVIDPVLTFLVTCALLSGYAALHRLGGRGTAWWTASYVFMALATLTKGPAGCLAPALVLLVYALLNRKQVHAGGKAHVLGAAIFAVIVAAWLIPALITGGAEYSHTILVKQNVGRVVQSYSHRQPFWYYVPRLVTHFFPWALFLPLAAYAAVRQRRTDGDGVCLFSVVWMGVYVLFFSLISGKRMGYLLPIAPALGIVTAWYLTTGVLQRPVQRAICVLILWVSFCCLMLFAAFQFAGTLFSGPLFALAESRDEVLREVKHAATPLWHAAAPAAAALPLLAVCFALVWLAVVLVICLASAFEKGHFSRASEAAQRFYRASVALLAASVFLLACSLSVVLMPVVNVYKSGKRFCEEAEPFLGAAQTVNLYDNDFSGVYNLYTGRVSMPVLETPEGLRAAAMSPGTAVIGDRKQFAKVFTSDELERLTLMQRDVGHRSMMLIGRLDGAESTR
jgi:4-amino-4-deoxy-L-arabinose transferase-like glycosyltransferase